MSKLTNLDWQLIREGLDYLFIPDNSDQMKKVYGVDTDYLYELSEKLDKTISRITKKDVNKLSWWDSKNEVSLLL